MDMLRKCIFPSCPNAIYGCVKDGIKRFCADCWNNTNGTDLCPVTDEVTHGICNACAREMARKRHAPKKG